LYEYDSLGRIVKVRTKYPFTPEIEQVYTYNAAGNSSAYANYDQKINLLRTHKLWMFLARDYSKNNPLTGASYNWMGLPVTTRQSTGRYLLPGGAVTPDHAVIAYKCQGQ
jgi:hypothetical protein